MSTQVRRNAYSGDMIAPHAPLCDQVQAIVRKQSPLSLRAKLAHCKIMWERLQAYGGRPHLKESAFYDYWRSLMLLQPFSLHRYQREHNLPVAVMEAWAEGREAPPYYLRRQQIEAALRFAKQRLEQQLERQA